MFIFTIPSQGYFHTPNTGDKKEQKKAFSYWFSRKEVVLPYLETHWSILERTRLKRKRTRPNNTNKQNNNSNSNDKTYGEVKYIYVVKKPQNSSQGLCLVSSLKPTVCIRMGNPGNPGPMSILATSLSAAHLVLLNMSSLSSDTQVFIPLA